jgi:magnesium chelatase family protein
VIVRGQRVLVFPTRVMLIAATNPCPCGYAGEPRCTCAEADLRRHQRRLSGPLLDRMDLLVNVERPTQAELEAPALTDSASTRSRVGAARERQLERLRGTTAGCNAELDAAAIRARVAISEEARAALGNAYLSGSLSARGRYRVVRVAQTIADLAAHPRIELADLLTALSLRQRHRTATSVQAC